MAGQLQTIQFGMQTAEARSPFATKERLTNWYAEASPKNAKSPIVLYPTPGLKLWATAGTGPIRGQHKMANETYAVSGQELYVIDNAKVATLLGTIEGTGHVYMADNDVHVGIVASQKAYAANRDGIVELPEGNFNGIAYQQGTALFTRNGNNEVYVGGLDDMTSIGGADFTTADGLTGTCKGIISDHLEPWVFKTGSTEVYANSGNPDFPFDRIGLIEHGCIAPGSPAKADNSVYWLGDDKSVYQARSLDPQRISPPWIEKLIEATGDPAGAWGFTYEQNGHIFYVLTFSDLTLSYDTTTGLWADRKTLTLDNWRCGKYSPGLGANALPLVGDIVNGNIYELDLSTYTENGATIQRQAVSPPVWANGHRVICHELYVDFEPGVGPTSGQGSAPRAMLDWSDDGGKTFGNEIWADIGALGEYGHRATWNRLGQFRSRMFRLTISDPIKSIVLGAYARLEVGES